jgi:hypothetical protein
LGLDELDLVEIYKKNMRDFLQKGQSLRGDTRPFFRVKRGMNSAEG